MSRFCRVISCEMPSKNRGSPSLSVIGTLRVCSQRSPEAVRIGSSGISTTLFARRVSRSFAMKNSASACGKKSKSERPISCVRGIPRSSSPAWFNRMNESDFASFTNTIAGMLSRSVSRNLFAAVVRASDSRRSLASCSALCLPSSSCCARRNNRAFASANPPRFARCVAISRSKSSRGGRSVACCTTVSTPSSSLRTRIVTETKPRAPIVFKKL